jgi:hypothetical protein
LLAGLYPIENRHRDIRDDDIRREASCGVEQSLAVRYAPDNFASWWHQTFYHHEELTMVIR